MRKKILCGILFVSVLLTLAGCGEQNDTTPVHESTVKNTAASSEKPKPTEPPTSESNSSEATSGNVLKLPEWLDGEFSVNGAKLTVPCTYEDVKALGFSIKEADLKTYGETKLDGTMSMRVSIFAYNDSGECIGLMFHNPSQEAKLLISECEVYGIQIVVGKAENKPPVVTMNNGIGSAVKTKADITAVMGEADHENNVVLTYYVNKKRLQQYGLIMFEFEAETGDFTGFTYLMPTVEFER